MSEDKETDDKEKKAKEPIKPIVLVPSIDKDGHAVFKCLSKDDEELVKTALSNPSGIKVKSEEGKTCPIDGAEYEKSVCKKFDDLFKKEKKCKVC